MSSAPIGRHWATLAMPGLPGAAYNFVQCGDWASFHARACSRPPPPITRIFMVNVSRVCGNQEDEILAAPCAAFNRIRGCPSWLFERQGVQSPFRNGAKRGQPPV